MSRRAMMTFCLAVWGLMSLAACNQTAYLRDGDRPKTGGDDALMTAAAGRHVSYGLSRDLFETAPRCVMVVPVGGPARGSEAASAIEEAVARHLSYRFARVVPARAVDANRRRAAIRSDDVKRLGRLLRCAAAMEIKTSGLARDYAFVWAEARLSLALQLSRVRDGKALWWGRHTAERSEGGLPLGILSVPIEAISAGRFAGDPDVLPSMADDAARRVLESLPAASPG